MHNDLNNDSDTNFDSDSDIEIIGDIPLIDMKKPDLFLNPDLENITELISIDSICYESYPCQHDTIVLIDGIKCESRLDAPSIWYLLKKNNFNMSYNTMSHFFNNADDVDEVIVNKLKNDKFDALKKDGSILNITDNPDQIKHILNGKLQVTISKKVHRQFIPIQTKYFEISNISSTNKSTKWQGLIDSSILQNENSNCSELTGVYFIDKYGNPINNADIIDVKIEIQRNNTTIASFAWFTEIMKQTEKFSLDEPFIIMPNTSINVVVSTKYLYGVKIFLQIINSNHPYRNKDIFNTEYLHTYPVKLYDSLLKDKIEFKTEDVGCYTELRFCLDKENFGSDWIKYTPTQFLNISLYETLTDSKPIFETVPYGVLLDNTNKYTNTNLNVYRLHNYKDDDTNNPKFGFCLLDGAYLTFKLSNDVDKTNTPNHLTIYGFKTVVYKIEILNS